MAIEAIYQAGSYDGVDRTSYTTTGLSATPAANSMLLAGIYLTAATNAGTPVISGMGLTWTNIGVRLDGGRSQALFRAQCGASPPAIGSNLTVTWTGGDATSTASAWLIGEVRGHDTVNPIVQYKLAGGDGTSSAAPTGVLTSPIAYSGNRVVNFVSHRANENTAARTNWTHVYEAYGSPPASGFEWQWRNDGTNETTFGATYTTVARYIMQAVEIRISPLDVWPWVEPFTYSDGRLVTVAPARWVGVGGSMLGFPVDSSPYVQSGTLTSPALEKNMARAVVDLPSNDQYAKMQVTTPGAAGDTWAAWVQVRGSTDAKSGYLLRYAWDYNFNGDDGGFEAVLYRVTAGSQSSLGMWAVASGTHTIEIRAIGNAISGWFDGTQLGSVTDATYLTARGSAIGLYTYGAGGGATTDNYEAGMLVPTTTGRPKVWTGSTWAQKPAKVWTGSAWVEKPVKVWTGSAWKTIT